jgi:hypothetical protein
LLLTLKALALPLARELALLRGLAQTRELPQRTEVGILPVPDDQRELLLGKNACRNKNEQHYKQFSHF